jgi:precorrin-6x reductase
MDIKRVEEKLLNPRPGSKIEAAKEFGIDLTLLVRKLKLTPEERIRELDDFVETVEQIRRQNPKLQRTKR